MKKTCTSLLLASLVISPNVYADTKQPTAKEIADLKKRVAALEKEDIGSTRALGIGNKEVFGIGSDQYNEELYINDFGVNTDLNLLHQRRFVHDYFGGFENAPNIMLSGNISGTVGAHSDALPIDESQDEQYMKAEAEIDLVAYANEDWLAYFEMNANAFGDDTDLGIEQGFVTYGNLDKVPVYLTVGYTYLPFGSFTTAFITNTLVRDMGRIQTPNLTFGYVFTQNQLNFNTSVFWFDGPVQMTEETELNQFGVNAQVRNEKLGPSQDMAITLGASVVNNMASATGIASNVKDDELEYYVPGVDLRFQFEKGIFTFLSEYLQATHSFDEDDFTQNKVGDSPDAIAPQASHVEAGFSFPFFSIDSQLSFAYDQTHDALAFELPQQQYGASYQLAPYKNTYVTFEYLHKSDYDKDTVATNKNGTIRGTGKQDNEAILQVNVYF